MQISRARLLASRRNKLVPDLAIKEGAIIVVMYTSESLTAIRDFDHWSAERYLGIKASNKLCSGPNTAAADYIRKDRYREELSKSIIFNHEKLLSFIFRHLLLPWWQYGQQVGSEKR